MAETVSVIDTVGPLFSGGGLKNWLLAFSPDSFIFIPLGIMPSIKAGAAAGVRSVGLMNSVYSRDPESAGEREIELKPEYSVLSLADIAEISMKKVVFGANELRIVDTRGKKYKYGIGEHAQTELIRTLIRQNYPEKFREQTGR